MGSRKIILLFLALLLLCSVSAQDTLRVSPFSGLGPISRLAVIGDTLTAGQPVYIFSGDNRVYRAERSSGKQAQAFCLTDGLPGDTTEIVALGRISDYPDTLAWGRTYYLGEVKGTITDIKPTTGTYQVLGKGSGMFTMEVDVSQEVTIVAPPLEGSATLDFGDIDEDGASSDLTITVTGAMVGDGVLLEIPAGSLSKDIRYDARVTSSNTVTVTLTNYKATIYNPASGTFKVWVFQ